MTTLLLLLLLLAVEEQQLSHLRYVSIRGLTGPALGGFLYFIDNAPEHSFAEMFRLPREQIAVLLPRFASEFHRRLVSSPTVIGRTRRRMVDARYVLCLVVRFCASGLRGFEVSALCGIGPSSLSRYLRLGLVCLVSTLWSRIESRPTFTSSRVRQVLEVAPTEFPGLVGLIDGKQHVIERSSDHVHQRMHYSGFKSVHCKKGLYVFLLDGTIALAKLEPGIVHDSRACDSWAGRFESVLGNELYLMGDSAFGVPQIIRPTTSAGLPTFHAIRSLAETGIRDLVCCWKALQQPLPADDPFLLELIWRNCILLYNFRVVNCQISHIRTYFYEDQ